MPSAHPPVGLTIMHASGAGCEHYCLCMVLQKGAGLYQKSFQKTRQDKNQNLTKFNKASSFTGCKSGERVPRTQSDLDRHFWPGLCLAWACILSGLRYSRGSRPLDGEPKGERAVLV